MSTSGFGFRSMPTGPLVELGLRQCFGGDVARAGFWLRLARQLPGLVGYQAERDGLRLPALLLRASGWPGVLCSADMTDAEATALLAGGELQRLCASGLMGPRALCEQLLRLSAGPTLPCLKLVFAHRQLALSQLPTATPAFPDVRLATVKDIDLVQRWCEAFVSELGLNRIDGPLAGDFARRRIEAQEFHLLEAEGECVSMAAHGPGGAGQEWLGFVYTPPEHRACGRASALLRTVVAQRIQTRRTMLLLFADLANPVSCRLYEQLGFQACGDWLRLAWSC